jgi:hypothetical protein
MLRIAKALSSIVSLLGITSFIGSVINGQPSTQSWFVAIYFLGVVVALNIVERLPKGN